MLQAGSRARDQAYSLDARGRRSTALPAGVRASAVEDVEDPASTAAALDGAQFDAVVDWIAFGPADIDVPEAFRRTHKKQFVFHGSASAYQKPSTNYLITESTPLREPLWHYSRDKIACEDRLMNAYREQGFPSPLCDRR